MIVSELVSIAFTKSENNVRQSVCLEVRLARGLMNFPGIEFRASIGLIYRLVIPVHNYSKSKIIQ